LTEDGWQANGEKALERLDRERVVCGVGRDGRPAAAALVTNDDVVDSAFARARFASPHGFIQMMGLRLLRCVSLPRGRREGGPLKVEREMYKDSLTKWGYATISSCDNLRTNCYGGTK